METSTRPGATIVRDRATGLDYIEAATGRRLGAIGVDTVIVVAIAITALGSLQFLDDTVLLLAWVAVVLATVAVLGGFSGLGCSPGQFVAGVETRRRDTGRRIGWWRGMWRYLYYPFLVFVVLASVFSDGSGPVIETRGLVTNRRPIDNTSR